jgi:hypothetical protein
VQVPVEEVQEKGEENNWAESACLLRLKAMNSNASTNKKKIQKKMH